MEQSLCAQTNIEKVNRKEVGAMDYVASIRLPTTAWGFCVAFFFP
jgi:hypothetical protein